MVRNNSKLALAIMEQHHYGGEYYKDEDINECPQCGYYKPEILYYSNICSDYVGCNNCIEVVK